jgi:GGDEF domain-containing protein
VSTLFYVDTSFTTEDQQESTQFIDRLPLFNHQETSQGSILKRADTAMYEAKHGGGNQIRFCGALAA